MRKDFGWSPLGVMIGIALVLTVIIGGCSVVASSCSAHGGSFNGDNLSCTMPAHR